MSSDKSADDFFDDLFGGLDNFLDIDIEGLEDLLDTPPESNPIGPDDILSYTHDAIDLPTHDDLFK